MTLALELTAAKKKSQFDNSKAASSMSDEVSTEPYRVALTIPFPSKRQAEIAYDVLRVDPEPKRSFITKQITLKEQSLHVEFSGEFAKNVRVGLTSFFEALILSCEVQAEFGPAAEKYDFYDG